MSQVPVLARDILPRPITVPRQLPGLGELPAAPQDNPLTAERIELGRRLFFDPILSEDRTIACASCHRPERNFADSEARAIGIGGRRGHRNAPSLLNRGLGKVFFWDGRSESLEEQALGPIANRLEMGTAVEPIIERLRRDPSYAEAFTKAFPDGVTPRNLGRAIASFERTLLLGDSAIDRFRAGNFSALTDQQRHGLWIFESRGKCWQCHSGVNFTDEKFHNTGVGWGRAPVDLGRFEVTRNDADRGAFKTPSLRGVAHTAPYMHDGSIATLREVVEFYRKGGVKNPHLDSIIEPLDLTEEDVTGLVAFLEALSDPPSWQRAAK